MVECYSPKKCVTFILFINFSEMTSKLFLYFTVVIHHVQVVTPIINGTVPILEEARVAFFKNDVYRKDL